MRVAIPTIDFDDDARAAVRASYGETGKATRADCVTFAEAAVRSALADLEPEAEEWCEICQGEWCECDEDADEY